LARGSRSTPAARAAAAAAVTHPGRLGAIYDFDVVLWLEEV